jgi:hypothetical protein
MSLGAGRGPKGDIDDAPPEMEGAGAETEASDEGAKAE